MMAGVFEGAQDEQENYNNLSSSLLWHKDPSSCLRSNRVMETSTAQRFFLGITAQYVVESDWIGIYVMRPRTLQFRPGIGRCRLKTDKPGATYVQALSQIRRHHHRCRSASGLG